MNADRHGLKLKFKMGWVKDRHDPRDFKFAMRVAREEPLPPKVMLDTWPAVKDQGNLGACTAFGITSCHETRQKIEGQKVVKLSTLALYYDERAMEGTIPYDMGAQIRDGMKVLAKQGSGSEKLWPYDIKRFKEKPPEKYYKDAEKRQALSYWKLDNTNLDELKRCLVEGHPFVFGAKLYTSFTADETVKTGIVPMPRPGRERMMGGHCMYCVGYNDETQRFTIVNSWGTQAGDKGLFYLPYDYLTDWRLAMDFWTIRDVEDVGVKGKRNGETETGKRKKRK